MIPVDRPISPEKTTRDWHPWNVTLVNRHRGVGYWERTVCATTGTPNPAALGSEVTKSGP